MKWLFAVLVALNIIVFGGMLVTRMAQQQQPVPVVQQQQPQPTTVVVQTAPAQPAAPQQPATPVPPVDTGRPRTAPAAPGRSNTPAKPAGEAQPKPTPESGIRAPSAACTAVAVLPEDDYHRIKGLLARWPHAATRVVEQRRDGGRSRQRGERYQVSAAVDGDAQETAAKLRTHGIRASVSGGRVNIGTFASEQQAEQAAAKARQAGLNPQIARTGGDGGEQSAALGESKMQVTFMNVDDNAAAGISSVISRYSHLRRAPCRK